MSKPLHLQIHDDLEAKIRSGELKPGGRIPIETELMVQYDCSRMTASRAINQLRTEGLIERRRKAGSFVTTPKLVSAVLDIPDIQVEVIARNQDYRFQLLSRSIRTASSEKEVELVGPSAKVLVLKGVHFANGKPLALEERVINIRALPQVLEVDFSQQSPGHWLLETVPWSEVASVISAENAATEVSDLFEAVRGVACLVVERRTSNGGQAITYVRQIFEGSAYRLAANFEKRGN